MRSAVAVVETVAAKVFNQTLAQLVTDTGLTSVTKQVVVCGFCREGLCAS